MFLKHLQPTGGLKDYHTTPNKKRFNINNLPPDEMRLHDEEIKSDIEFQRDSTGSSNETTKNSNLNSSTKTDSEDGEDIFDINSRTNV